MTDHSTERACETDARDEYERELPITSTVGGYIVDDYCGDLPSSQHDDNCPCDDCARSRRLAIDRGADNLPPLPAAHNELRALFLTDGAFDTDKFTRALRATYARDLDAADLTTHTRSLPPCRTT